LLPVLQEDRRFLGAGGREVGGERRRSGSLGREKTGVENVADVPEFVDDEKIV